MTGGGPRPRIVLAVCGALILGWFAADSRTGGGAPVAGSATFARDFRFERFLGRFSRYGNWIVARRDAVRGRIRAQMPSADAIDGAALSRRVAVVSLVVHKADLDDPEFGIAANKNMHGLDWERPGYLSFYENGRQVFASRVGVRIQGRASRGWTRPDNKSVRLYFRQAYGSGEIPSAAVFAGAPGNFASLVVRPATPSLDNLLGFAIVRRLGGRAPRTRPAVFYLNGKRLALYVLTEHLGAGYPGVHFGQRPTREIDAEPSITAAELEPAVDTESLLARYMADLICLPPDASQGAVLAAEAGADRPASEAPRLRLWLKLARDPAFQRRFAARLNRALNHVITPAWVTGTIERHRALAKNHGATDLSAFARQQALMDDRPAQLRRRLQHYFGAGRFYRVRLDGPGYMGLIVDGFPATTRYRGWYFETTPITVRVDAASRARFSHWMVNGERRDTDSPRITLAIRRDTRIEIVATPPPKTH